MNGTIDRLEVNKGFGFIKGEDEKNYFFHRDDFLGFFNDLVYDYNTIEDSIKVEFRTDKTMKGLRARNVKRLDFPNQAA